MKIINKISGLFQNFEIKHLEDFTTEKEYINYVADMYLNNPWALDEYQKILSQVQHLDSFDFMNTVCLTLQAHKKKAFMPDYVFRKHQTLNCEINRLLRSGK